MPQNTPIMGFQVPAATDDPNVAEDIMTLATAIEKHVVMVFNTSIARDASVTAPTEGMHAYLKDTNVMTKYNGSSWENAYPAVPAITSGTAAPINSNGANGDVYFQV
jgi:hypothetical protein